MRVPSKDVVARVIRAHHKAIDLDSEGTDVRLQVLDTGSWQVHVGSSDYDQDHRGYWGASFLPRGRFNSLDLARELLSQVRDHMAGCRQKVVTPTAPMETRKTYWQEHPDPHGNMDGAGDDIYDLDNGGWGVD